MQHIVNPKVLWRHRKALSLALLLGASSSIATAHPVWLLPSEFVLSSKEPVWITVDASASNHVFIYDHGIPLERAKIASPDGKTRPVGTYFKGQRRSVFDLQLDQEGTWKLSASRPATHITYYEHNGEKNRIFATKTDAKKRLPNDAKLGTTTLYHTATHAYVTWGAPSDKVLETTGKGLELVAKTHPNDLVAGEKVTLQFLLNGKPAANIDVDATPSNTLYRDDRMEIHARTDAQGYFSFTPSLAGPWLVGAHTEYTIPSPDADKEAHLLYLTLEVQVQ